VFKILAITSTNQIGTGVGDRSGEHRVLADLAPFLGLALHYWILLYCLLFCFICVFVIVWFCQLFLFVGLLVNGIQEVRLCHGSVLSEYEPMDPHGEPALDRLSAMMVSVFFAPTGDISFLPCENICSLSRVRPCQSR